MISEALEHNIILVGWVTAFLLGLLLLLKKSPAGPAYRNYKLGKNTCAIAMLLFGAEILFQWILHIYETGNALLSVSVYLFTFSAATLLNATGCCIMLRPELMNRRQIGYSVLTQLVFTLLLVVSCCLPGMKWKVNGLLVCCVVLFLITCLGIYYCVRVYLSTIDNLRKYYSDMVESMIRWMPGVGAGALAFLISAPFICWLPRWAGVYQVSLGIIMFVYTFVCMTNFCSDYKSVSAALQVKGSADAEGVDSSVVDVLASDDESECMRDGALDLPRSTAMSESLQDVMKDKEQRWREHGGYRAPGVTIEQAAREMGTNRSYLSRYLNEVRHVTFYEWVSQMRVDEAKVLLLAERDLSIEKIATMVGFTSASTFSSTFKKMVGVSPKHWRNLH